MSSSINLRIVTENGDITFTNVIEYVTGRLNFYIYYRKNGSDDVAVIQRSIIKDVFRFNRTDTWRINLKQFKG